MHPFYQLDINNIDNLRISEVAFFSFFFFSYCILYIFNIVLRHRYLIVILVKVASCSCVHSFVDACS